MAATFRIEPNPNLAKYLLGGPLFCEDPIVIVDVGSRGGFNPEWQFLGDRAKIFCFEPDESECERLAANARPGVTYVPWALAGNSGEATLYETKLSASTGLYKTNMSYFSRLLNRDNGIVVGESRVTVRKLDEAMRDLGVGEIDFIKLDVEGAELDILLGSKAYLEQALPLGLLSEIRFHREINGSPSFAELDIFLRPLGLSLYNLQYYHQSRDVLPYPSLHDYRLPSGERFFAYTTQGQIQDGDALYFRDTMLSGAIGAKPLSPIRVLKLAALFEIYSLSDCAAEIILANRDELSRVVDCDRLLDLLATTVAGYPTTFKDYKARYFNANARETAAPVSAAISADPEQLREQLAQVYASTSWRITKPLRSLKLALRR